MSTQSLESAIRDVAPTLLEPFPEKLKQLTNQLYRSSKQKIPLKVNEEVARLHLCALIAIQKLQSQLNIMVPSLNNLPIPAKLGRSLLVLFQTHLNSNTTPNPTPNSTPKLKRTIDDPSTPSPSPSKKARMKGRPVGSKSKTPFMRKLEATIESSPSKDLTQSLKGAKTNEDTEDSPQKIISKTTNLQLLTSRQIISLCNKFQLEKEIADQIIETFLKFSSNISNEWILIVGLILNCYFVINHKALNENLGNKTIAFKIMHSLQSGDLKFTEIQSSVEVVENIVHYTKWFKQLKNKYGYPIDEGTNFDDAGYMFSDNYQYFSKNNVKKYKDWEFEIQQALQ